MANIIHVISLAEREAIIALLGIISEQNGIALDPEDIESGAANPAGKVTSAPDALEWVTKTALRVIEESNSAPGRSHYDARTLTIIIDRFNTQAFVARKL